MGDVGEEEVNDDLSVDELLRDNTAGVEKGLLTTPGDGCEVEKVGSITGGVLAVILREIEGVLMEEEEEEEEDTAGVAVAFEGVICELLVGRISHLSG